MANAVKNILILMIVTIFVTEMDAATPIRECGKGKPLPLMVQLDNCKTLPCDLWKGTTSNMAIQFVATKDSMTSLRADVRLSTLGANVPFELSVDRSDICNNLLYGAYCPLDSGEDVTYNLEMEIIEQQPEVPVKLEVNLIDRNDESVVACFITDAKVKKQRI